MKQWSYITAAQHLSQSYGAQALKVSKDRPCSKQCLTLEECIGLVELFIAKYNEAYLNQGIAGPATILQQYSLHRASLLALQPSTQD